MRSLLHLPCLVVSLLLSQFLYAQPFPVPPGVKCDECGMAVGQDSKFASEVISSSGKKLFFCDIGDMLYHFRKERGNIRISYVRDYVTGDWIEGEKALFVLNKDIKSPMSWGIAAFAKESDARKWGTPVDFSTAFTLTK
ncbi:MAG TPA: nitrous oxide reductase accessory protein NosL [Thermodesulfovibrionales bacterium]|nr:nitrous oxide reductase accessory protein NosL [Thermodesulfovibrionales bacterium]